MGPWKIKNGKNYYHIHGDQEVALVENWMNETPRANARLIAAAPDMLEALRYAVEYLEANPDDDDEYTPVRDRLHAARAAIAKAEGGAS